MSSGTSLAKPPSPIWWGLTKSFAPLNRIPTLEQRQVLVLSRSLAQTLLVLVQAILVAKPSRWLIHILKIENITCVSALAYTNTVSIPQTTNGLYPTHTSHIHAPHAKTIHTSCNNPATRRLIGGASDLLTISCNLFLLPRVSSTFIQFHLMGCFTSSLAFFLSCFASSLHSLFIPVLCYPWKYSIPYFFRSVEFDSLHASRAAVSMLCHSFHPQGFPSNLKGPELMPSRCPIKCSIK
jgi:hypothetical protein